MQVEIQVQLETRVELVAQAQLAAEVQPQEAAVQPVLVAE